MIIKRIAGICFAIAFLMAIVLFTNIGREYIGYFTARLIFIIAGAIGLVLNLVSFNNSNHPPLFSIFYWVGSIVFFTGLIFIIFHWPYSQIILLMGAILVGGSFFLPQIQGKDEKEELLDDDF